MSIFDHAPAAAKRGAIMPSYKFVGCYCIANSSNGDGSISASQSNFLHVIGNGNSCHAMDAFSMRQDRKRLWSKVAIGGY
jgi:hypothetical protein